MRDMPFESEADHDFRDFLEHVSETFLVYLDEQQVLLCEDLGEFVQLVYKEIQADRSLLNNQAAMYERMIDQMNSASFDQKQSEFSLQDLDEQFEMVLKDRAKKNWTELGYAVQSVLGSDAAQIQMKTSSKVSAWILFLVLLAGMVFVGVNNGFFLTAVLCVAGLIAFAKIANDLPCRVSKPGITMKQIMDRRIERLANRQVRMSVAEVRLCIFDAYASWAGDQDPDSIQNTTSFPY